jgi:hypothetical protein
MPVTIRLNPCLLLPVLSSWDGLESRSVGVEGLVGEIRGVEVSRFLALMDAS